MLADAGRAGFGGHTNLYALFVVRALRWVRPGGGLVFVLPTSFVAGPYFAGGRHEVLSRAEVLRIDLHEQRENLFVDAVQDVCLLALQRREGVAARGAGAACQYELGLIDAAGRRTALDTAIASLGGEPWMLPVPIGRGSRLRGPISRTGRAFVLADYGYRARVGKVVPTRERKRLREARGKVSLPLVWASDIRPDGTFAFAGSRRPGIASWYDAPPNISYATRGSAVLIQRTSNRDQRRRLYAAAVPTSFLDRYQECGFVAENHVIVLEAIDARPAIAPAILA